MPLATTCVQLRDPHCDPISFALFQTTLQETPGLTALTANTPSQNLTTMNAVIPLNDSASSNSNVTTAEQMFRDLLHTD
jgi:hypothetical protein